MIATTLNGGINAVVTALTVRDALGFPSAGEYKVTIGTERLLVTAGQGTTGWTVTRGVDDTTAAIHADGASVYLYQESYATIDDLLLTMGMTVDNALWIANATQRLKDATRDIDRQIPSALQVTESRIYTARGGVLHVHGGFLSLTGIDIRLSTGAAWTALQAQETGWVAEGYIGDPSAVNDVYYHVRLLDIGTYDEFPADVVHNVRLTGTFGGDTEARRSATVAWARQRIALDPSMPGGVTSGPEDLGAAVSLDRWPREVFDLIDAERHRFWCHV